jgi:outer membrane protein OmpA-like peptidoglycan-associated protein/uncharacterized protein YceK
MKRNILIAIVVAGITASGCSTIQYHRGNKNYNAMAYHKASEWYTKSLERQYRPEAMLRLAGSYAQMRDYVKAEYWYGKAVNLPEATSTEKLVFANVLKCNGKYTAAKTWFRQYLAEVPGDDMAKAQMVSCDKMNSYNEGSNLYTTQLINQNNNTSNFSITPFENGYVYSTELGGDDVNINPWNGRPYLSLVYNSISEYGKAGTPELFSHSITGPFHVGPAVFNSTYNKIYFSKSSYKQNGRPEKSAAMINNIKLYWADRKGADWVNMEELPFSSNEYSCSHPAVTADGRTMYFVSDRPGGFGKADLYITTLENGKWSKPQNMGANFNTPGDEMFPYYYKDENGTARLYFSSDGREGMGGLDLYYTEQQQDGRWAAPVHMNAPFNSSRDDFGILLKKDGSGYFSSSRNGNGDVDQLFAFYKVAPKFFADGVVYSKKSNLTIPNARVQLFNKTAGGEEKEIYTDPDGKFSVPLQGNSSYELNASKDGYLPAGTFASTEGKTVSERLQVTIYLDTAGYVLFMPNIYFDFDKYKIRPDAAMQLDKVAAFLLDNPEVRLEVDAHADSRGTQPYNMKLTEKRAAATVNYIISRGINPDRILSRWHGKLMPVNECIDGVVCSPAKHQQNRRSEMKVIREAGKGEAKVAHTNKE